MTTFPIPESLSAEAAFVVTLIMLGGVVWYAFSQIILAIQRSRREDMSEIISGYKAMVERLEAQVMSLNERSIHLEARVHELEQENRELKLRICELERRNNELLTMLNEGKKCLA